MHLQICTCLLLAFAGPRYLQWPEVREMMDGFSGSTLPGTGVRDAAAWDQWIRARDAEIRARADRGMEDAISSLILRGMENTHDALSEDGKLSPAAEARVKDFASTPMAGKFLERLQSPALRRKYLEANLRRTIFEQWTAERKMDRALRSGDPALVLAARGARHDGWGLSPEADFRTNFAIDECLRFLASTRKIAPYSIRRAAIVGPGLEFSGSIQSVQPFALIESLTRLALSPPARVDLVTLDLAPVVNEHLFSLAARTSYKIILERDARDDWSQDLISYWDHFGEYLGRPVKPTWIKLIHPVDLDLITQTLDPPLGGFDLVVATNVFDYYNPFEQALGLASIANLLKKGGLFLSTDTLPPQHPLALDYLGRHSVYYQPMAASGDDVVIYRKR